MHNVNYISARTGRVVMLPVLCTRAGKIVASFPAFLQPVGAVVTTEEARAITHR